VDEHIVSVISLDAPEAEARLIEIPTAMIDENLATLKERVKISYQQVSDTSWMSARVVQVGVLESGEFAFVTHSGGPADETYGYLYAMANNNWYLVRDENCHRFDPCHFEEVLSHSLNERPSNMTIWHPEIRRNPYFVEKTESRVVNHEYFSWNGIVTFNIDGQQSLLHYTKGEGGHCAGDCAYTAAGLKLELADQSIVEIGQFGGNNAIVDRYALVWAKRPSVSELIDLGTGKSVLGELKVAGWLH